MKYIMEGGVPPVGEIINLVEDWPVFVKERHYEDLAKIWPMHASPEGWILIPKECKPTFWKAELGTKYSWSSGLQIRILKKNDPVHYKMLNGHAQFEIDGCSFAHLVCEVDFDPNP